MRKKGLLIFTLFFLFGFSARTQSYSLIIKGGHVIDPKNNIDGIMDVAVRDGKIAAVSQNIDSKEGQKVIDAKGLYVTPGLIDIHGHVFAGTLPDGELSNGFSSLPADGFTFRTGVTTIVDAGCAGAKQFADFKKNAIDRSPTRVLAFLNISSEGMRGDEMSDYQQNTAHMDPVLAANTAKEYKDYIVGIKVAHFHSPDFIAVDRAVEAGKLANLPVMVDFGGSKPRLSIKDLFLKHLRPGDIFTHTFGQLLETKETIVDVKSQKLEPFVPEARKRGIIFDVGHGAGSFTYSQAIPAAKAGFYPNTISTDLHTGSMNAGMKDMLNVMSKFLALGMDLQSVIKASTWSAAQAIRREELGHLSPGAVADITLLDMHEGKFGFYDVAQFKMEGNRKLECEMTVREGKIVYDLNARSIPFSEYGSGFQVKTSKQGTPMDAEMNEQVYEVSKLKKPMKINADWNKAQWEKIETIRVEKNMGDIPKFQPVVEAKMMYDDKNVYVIFRVQDRFVKSTVTEYNGPVSENSCVEFFFSPDSAMPLNYFNLEINAGGTPLIFYVTKPRREYRALQPNEIKQIEIAHSLPKKVDPEITDPVTWTIEYRIPLSILKKYSNVTQPAPGVIWKGNFYKTGSNTSNPNYLTWSFVDNPVPDFHLPQFFGTLKFQ